MIWMIMVSPTLAALITWACSRLIFRKVKYKSSISSARLRLYNLMLLDPSQKCIWLSCLHHRFCLRRRKASTSIAYPQSASWKRRSKWWNALRKRVLNSIISSPKVRLGICGVHSERIQLACTSRVMVSRIMKLCIKETRKVLPRTRTEETF